MRLPTDRLNILIVCTANLVRSPFAERLLQTRLDEVAPGLATVTSAGTQAAAGATMDDRSVIELSRRGVDSARFSSRLISRSLLADSDIVLGMERTHVKAVLTQWPEGLNRTFALEGFAHILTTMERAEDAVQPTVQAGWRALVRGAAVNRGLAAGANRDIADPHNDSVTIYQSTMAHIEEVVDATVFGLVQNISTSTRPRL